MRTCLLVSVGFVAFAGLLAPTAAAQPASSAPPAGFTSLFNGKNLGGWRGRPGGGGVFSPYVEAKFTPEERAAKQAEWSADRDLHWRADSTKGEIVSDGKGVHLATEKAYGDFEFRVDWMLTQSCGDSGVYLRDYPQVQLWDPACPHEQRNGADKGSGGLWNNNAANPGKWPLVKADNPIGQWNTMAVKMAGTRVWVTLNGKEVVVGQVLDNFFDRTQPVLPTGSIELQTHGSEVRFRNIYVREIPESEGRSLLAGVGGGVPAPAAGNASLNGKWQIHISAAGNERDQTCAFTQKGNELAGTCSTDRGAVQISGKIDGRNVTWAYKSDYNGSPLTVTFRGSLESTTKVTGAVIAEEFGVEGEFTATQSR